MHPTPIEIIATVLFALALVHTFMVVRIHALGTRYPAHAGLFHLLGEVEAVFALWACALVALMFALQGKLATLKYLNERNYTEPLFVFAVMLIAASYPVLSLVQNASLHVARLAGGFVAYAQYFLTLAALPLLGSLLTEPAAMTLAALTLGAGFFAFASTDRARYVTLGTLFVNVSIGGVLTSYAAPPVLMVAGTWGWGTPHMFMHFGWKAIIAVAINAALATWLVRATLASLVKQADLPTTDDTDAADLTVDSAAIIAPSAKLPALIHCGFLAGVVIFSHEPVVFMGLLLLFIAYTQSYRHHQRPLIWREALMVGCFLAGLVILGGLQQWWLAPTLSAMSPTAVYFGAMGLTAITDNAALTYLASQVPNLSDTFKYFVLAGAVVGGGLTVIANAPNPAGAAIVGKYFPESEISPLKLLLGAVVPTAIAALCFGLF
jgi:hypothetical protein